MVKTIAEQEKIPIHFLAKILQQLARKGLLRSSKGPQGGFVLNLPPEEIRLLDVVEALDGLPPVNMNGIGTKEWVELQNEIIEYLKSHTLASMAKALEAKQRALARRTRRRATKRI
jgi:Rrf2 family transcriptional regulator, iron-sulfur cluster assembly transcription factor